MYSTQVSIGRVSGYGRCADLSESTLDVHGWVFLVLHEVALMVLQVVSLYVDDEALLLYRQYSGHNTAVLRANERFQMLPWLYFTELVEPFRWLQKFVA